MRILVACEHSGTVRDAFRAKGHEALSCDLLTSDVPGPHYTGDVFDIVGDGWDMMIAFPPCTYLCVSGIHWNNRGRGWDKTDGAARFFAALYHAPIAKIAIENPVGVMSTRLRKPDQIVHPYQFGDDASKRTCLWLRGLPTLRPTAFVAPRLVEWNGKTVHRWSNQCDSNQNRLGPSDDRWKLRSRTYPGIAAAMADQWGG